MRDPEETLEELGLILDDLKERSQDEVILVEGQKDRAALAVLGVDGDVRQVQGPGTVFALAEELAREGKRVIILTDWDRRGGQLAQLLRDGLKANGVRFDDELRMKLAVLLKKDIKDIESLPAFFTRMVSLAQSPEVQKEMEMNRARKARKEHRANRERKASDSSRPKP
jgi:dTMP kinase